MAPGRIPRNELEMNNEELRLRLEEAEETLRAIREGEVDAIIISGSKGEQVFSISGADAVYRQIVETMKEAAFTVTFDGQVLYCNAQFGELIKRPMEQIVGRSLFEFVMDNHREISSSLLTAAQREPTKCRIVFRAFDGTAIPAYVSSNMLSEPGRASICLVASDLSDLENSTEAYQQLRQQQDLLRLSEEALRARTDELEASNLLLGAEIGERRKTEEQLKDLNESLETRVKERSSESEHRAMLLRRLAADLAMTEQRERKRLALVLHDGLQQILVAAKFQIALLERAGDIQQIAAELSKLIDNSIETSRSLTAELSPPVLHRGSLLSALGWLVQSTFEKHGLSVDLIARGQIGPTSEEISVLLFHSIRELLFNVVKHGGTKKARVEVKQSNGLIQVEVADEGAGFNPEDFRHGSGSIRGMGLFNIMERLTYIGGKMEIDAAPGRGSLFRLIAPRAGGTVVPPDIPSQPGNPVEFVARSDPGNNPEDTTAIRVVLVDDHRVMRQGLASLLAVEPDIVVVGEASDGISAIDVVRDTRPAVVLMDISMPGMDGVEATKRIHQEMPEIKVIGLSMFQKGEQKAAICEAGAVNYVAKTDPSDTLVEAIRSCVRE